MTFQSKTAELACVPRATYRLQFHKGFTLRDATELVPFLEELGISHVYASPLLKAIPGSTHGYDVCDFSQLNPELGTEANLETFVGALRERGLGLVLDIVPNHMGLGAENPWWWDVLLHGQNSPFANHFDIDWNPPDPRLHGKVLVPVLGDEYQTVRDTGSFEVQIDRARPVLRYFNHTFPLVLTPQLVRQRPLTEVVAELNDSPRALEMVLHQQCYRLVCWRYGDAQVNYRRFFNICSLGGLRVEDPVVFDAVHECVFRWHARGWVDGFRVDHIDGLRDPAGYLQKLRAAAPGAWLLVEKILGPNEPLPDNWPIAGTSGYDFLNRVSGLFINPAGEQPLTELYARFTGEPTDCAAVIRDGQRQVLREMLVAEVNRLLHFLVKAAARDGHGQSLPQPQLREALIEIMVCFPVYRSYVQAGTGLVSETDEMYITQAVNFARRERMDLAPALFEFIGDLLLLRWDGEAEREFVMRFQQLTGPTMAKGVEDTACYRMNRLLALNTVGGDLGQFGIPPERFHLACIKAQHRWPHAMLATSTHDTKRGEDVRARISLLSEIPEQWAQALQRWSALTQRYHSGKFPDRNMEYFFYQTLVGAWPLPLDRAWVVMEKASCEAKQHTSWSARNADYDRILREFVAHALGDPQFIGEVGLFMERLVEPGYVNSLAQTLLKLTAPGVPDIYQGNVLWDWSLVDPDNRRPVDFESRQRALVIMRQMSIDQVWQRRSEGYPKLWLIQRTLQFRRRHPEFFGAAAKYEPLCMRGSRARHAVGFLRGNGVAVVVPRLVMQLAGDWAETKVTLPAGDWHNELTGDAVVGGPCALADLLKKFPVALLVRKEVAA